MLWCSLIESKNFPSIQHLGFSPATKLCGEGEEHRIAVFTINEGTKYMRERERLSGGKGTRCRHWIPKF